MDEILVFDSTGSIEYYPDPDYVEEEAPHPDERTEEDQEQIISDPEEKEEDQEQKEEDQELKEEDQKVKEEDTKNENREVQYIYIKSDPVSVSDDIINNNNNQTVGIISQNIIDTPLNEYDITNSLLVFMIVMFMGVGIIWLIKRSIFKWN